VTTNVAPPAPDFAGRFRRFWLELEKRGADAFLVNHAPNLFYLFNVRPSAGFALCTRGEALLILDSRYTEQAEAESVNCRLRKAEKSLEETLQQAINDAISPSASAFRLAIESRNLSFSAAQQIAAWNTKSQLIPGDEILDNLRIKKEPYEIRAMEEAFRIAQTAFAEISRAIIPDTTEVEIAGLFELELRRLGADKAAFDTIVASGPRSSLPHGRATRRRIKEGELVLVDFGVQAAGYCSDLTRIHFPAGSSKPQIFDIVAEAQQKAIAATKPGVLTSAVDAAARDHIRESGYGDCFGHGTGHGLGLEVHEAPPVSWRSPRPLEEGMVFTIEPGIYLPGRHGVRIEDVVVVTADGCRLLSDPTR